MGGYGRYVWGAFVLTAVVLIALLVSAYRRRAQALASAQQEENL